MKSEYGIQKGDRNQVASLLENYHYLHTKKISKAFKFDRATAYILTHGGMSWGNAGCGRFGYDVVGACLFTALPVPELVVGLFGMDKGNQVGMLELSRLVIDPVHQGNEHNLATWFLARAIKLLRNEHDVRMILSYADSDFHNGTIYAAANFKYYGLTDEKCDFWIEHIQGQPMIKHSRGKLKSKGEWRPRSRKHRFLMIFDRSLVPKWNEEKWSSDHHD